MSSHSLHLIKHIRRLPTPPAIITELMRDFQNSEVSIDKVATKIGKDQALSASVLRLANSTFFGMRGRIGSLRGAAVVLGTHNLRTLAIAAGLARQFFDLNQSYFDWHAFWQHAFAAAICAKSLAKCRGQDSELAFTAGLLHDIGTLALVTALPEEYEKAIVYAREHQVSQIEAERAVMDFDHAQAGAVLVSYWNLPTVIEQVVAHHHQPETRPLSSLTDVIYATDVLTRRLDRGAPIDTTALAETVWARIDLELPQIQLCAEEAATGAEEITALLMEQCPIAA